MRILTTILILILIVLTTYCFGQDKFIIKEFVKQGSFPNLTSRSLLTVILGCGKVKILREKESKNKRQKIFC
jgi:hypothetical protein